METTKKVLTKQQQEVLSYITEYVDRTGFFPAAKDIAEVTGGTMSAVYQTLHRIREKGYLEGVSIEKRPKINDIQLQICEYIDKYASEHGFSPTYSEIAENFGWASLSTVRFHIKKLVKAGYLQNADGKGKRRVLNLVNSRKITVDNILIENAENGEEDYVAYEAKEGEDCFALRIRDDSMTREGVLKGDVVIACKIERPEIGDFVVVKEDASFYCGKFDDKDGNPVLFTNVFESVPINIERCQMLGVVREIRRKY